MWCGLVNGQTPRQQVFDGGVRDWRALMMMRMSLARGGGDCGRGRLLISHKYRILRKPSRLHSLCRFEFSSLATAV